MCVCPQIPQNNETLCRLLGVRPTFGPSAGADGLLVDDHREGPELRGGHALLAACHQPVPELPRQAADAVTPTAAKQPLMTFI